MNRRLTSLNQLVLSGQTREGLWRLNRLGQVEYRKRGKEQALLFQGEIGSAKPVGLEIRSSAEFLGAENVQRLLALKGRWQVDSKNRLVFLVERQQGRADSLTLEGQWRLGENHELLYRVRSRADSAETLLRFEGHWQIDDQRRLIYLLDRSGGGAFRFRGTFQTPSLIAKEGAIRYQIGAQLEGGRSTQTLTLFGQWKLSRDLGLSFEIPYRNGRLRSLDFEAEYRIDSQNRVVARLKTRQGKPLGIEVILTRNFLKTDGELFVRLRRSLEESAVEGGVRFRW